MPITPHANGEPLLKRSSSYSFPVCNDSVVWSANGDAMVVLLVTSKASSNLLNDDTYQCVCAGNCVIHRTNRARCALCKKILDLLTEESVSGESSGRASL